MDVTGRSEWRGAFRDGEGTISTESATLRDVPYTFASRFEGAPGACPKELLAAAHAACFNHAIANICGVNGLTPERIATSARVTMGRDECGHPAIVGIHFRVEARVPGLDADQLESFADMARVGCSLSKRSGRRLTRRRQAG